MPAAEAPPKHGAAAPSAPPTLISTLASDDQESVLSLVVDEANGFIFGASQVGDIHVWSLSTFLPVTRLVGHTSSVLCLALAPERRWLFSSSGDNSVRVWDSKHFGHALYTVSPPHDNAGDVLSLAWSSAFGMLYLGFQDTSIQWTTLPLPSPSPDQSKAIDLPGSPGAAFDPPLSSTPPAVGTPAFRGPHKFFDSLSQAELIRARRDYNPGPSRASELGTPAYPEASGAGPSSMEMDRVLSLTSRLTACSSRGSSSDYQVIRDADLGVENLTIDSRNAISYAHFGYVYTMSIASIGGKPVLVSGSGDGSVKIWSLGAKCGQPTEPALATLNSPVNMDSDSDAVLALAVRQSTLFVGQQGGHIKVWDLETLTCIRTLTGHKEDVLTLSVLSNGELLSGCAGGQVTRWDASFERVLNWNAHKGCVLTSTSTAPKGHKASIFLTGGSDNCIRVWDVYPQPEDHRGHTSVVAFQGRMLRHLGRFVAMKSISDEAHREECRQAALFLKKTLTNLGADAKLLPGAPGRNPLVLATFSGRAPSSGRRKKRVLFYGHYDVVQPGAEADWRTPPFTMTGKNGFLYGRGVSDNKGPILAIACAASSLLDERALDVDLVMLVEGEEEAGSAGFQDAVQMHKAAIGEIDVILVSNSYWLGDETPCMTFGLRGVIHATVRVTSGQPDLHSGMQGGVVHEPVLDLVRVLNALVDESGAIRIPGFYDGVSKVTEEEDKLYDRIVEHFGGARIPTLLEHSHVSDPRTHLMAKWRTPALSVHKIDVSGPAHSTVIPSVARSAVSIRLVPDQSLDDIAAALKSHLRTAFARLESANTLEVEIHRTADWWLGEPASAYSKAFSESIKAEWGVEPLWIREGGSIPGVPFLEREFNVKAVHLPMGAGSDSAHLPNERIRMLNLNRGKDVVARFLRRISSIGS